MNDHTHLLETLREHGVRLTPQRVAILEIVTATEGHITADEVYAGIHPRYPYVDMSTVYRTLEFLKDQGILNVIDVGNGRAEYELVGRTPHHHLVCRRCKHITSIDAGLFESMEQAILDRYGFAADISHFAIFGLCDVCRQTETD